MRSKLSSRSEPSVRTRGCTQLERHVPAYREYLLGRGNAAGYVRSCEAAVMHVSMWMHQTNLGLADVDETLVVEFLEGHLPQCNCETSARHPACVRAALAHLLVVLREAGAIRPKPQDETAVGEELRRYDQYMTQVRGLAPKTREGALRLVGALLRQHFGDVRDFHHTVERQTVGTSFRAYHEKPDAHPRPPLPRRASSTLTRSAICISGTTASTPPA